MIAIFVAHSDFWLRIARARLRLSEAFEDAFENVRASSMAYHEQIGGLSETHQRAATSQSRRSSFGQ